VVAVSSTAAVMVVVARSLGGRFLTFVSVRALVLVLALGDAPPPPPSPPPPGDAMPGISSVSSQKFIIYLLATLATRADNDKSTYHQQSQKHTNNLHK
jgi:hypothetical protein